MTHELSKAIELARQQLGTGPKANELARAVLYLNQAVEEAEKIIKDCNMCAEWQRTHMDCADWLEKYGKTK